MSAAYSGMDFRRQPVRRNSSARGKEQQSRGASGSEQQTERKDSEVKGGKY